MLYFPALKKLTCAFLLGVAFALPVKAEPRITTIALEDTEAPGMDGKKFEFFNQPAINDAGQVAFRGLVENQGFLALNRDVESGLFFWDGTKLQLALRTAKNEIKIKNAPVKWVHPNVHILPDERMVFELYTDNLKQMYWGTTNAFEPFYDRNASPLPEVAPFSLNTPEELQFAGPYYTMTIFCREPENDNCQEYLLLGTRDGFKLVQDLWAPFELSDGTSIPTYQIGSRVNADGQLLIFADGRVDDHVGGGLYLFDGGNRATIYEEPIGTEIPPLLIFNENLIAMNDAGQLAFSLLRWTPETRSYALFYGDRSNEILDTAKIELEGNWEDRGISTMCMDVSGRILFLHGRFSETKGREGGQIYSAAVVEARPDQPHKVLLAPGDEIEVQPGDFRNVMDIGGPTEEACHINASGQLAVVIRFYDDTSGIFIIEPN